MALDLKVLTEKLKQNQCQEKNKWGEIQVSLTGKVRSRYLPLADQIEMFCKGLKQNNIVEALRGRRAMSLLVTYY